MIESTPASRRTLGSDLQRVDTHVIQPEEYQDLPELTAEMLARGRLYKGGRPKATHPKRQITIRLTDEVIQRWRATGPGWQTRMAERLSQPLPDPLRLPPDPAPT